MPLRFPRPVMALLAMGLACASIVLGCAPALADQVRQDEWWLTKLGVTEAWQAGRGAGVTVAVLSDGVNGAQADLAGTVISGPDYTNSGQSADPYFGLQGTAIASLIAGHGHGAGGSSGIVGVAPAASILSVRVTLPATDPELITDPAVAAGLPGAIASGIRYAVAHGATVIDLPIDPGEPAATQAGAASAAGGSAAEKAAVAYALSRNVVLVAPAGDDGDSTDAPDYPAAYPGVIAVGAVDSNFTKAYFSSGQPYAAITAAGDDIAAAAGGGYQAVSSTSAASAVVAGIAALIRARFPSLSPALVTRSMTSSAVGRTAGGIRSGSGYGTVNAARALSAAAALLPSAVRQGGALPRVELPAPPAPSARAGLDRRLLRDLILSAGVLVALLLLIALYVAVSTLRKRSAAPGPERRAAAPRNALAPAQDADRMLEFFAAPSAPPEPADAESAAGAALPRRPSGVVTASRAAARRPEVSGAPPWGPAPEPPGELPWSALPAPGGPGRAAGAPQHQASPWGSSAGSPSPVSPAGPVAAGARDAPRALRRPAWPAGRRSNRAPQASAGATGPSGGEPPSRAEPSGRAARGRQVPGGAAARPDAAEYWPAADAADAGDTGHGWDPVASTETFPAYPGELSPPA